ncbi:MAG: hypothetical protein GY827_03415 [Cytophagales bacterium]|nr:hypothetical protein [Cytophagales bacterium]
MSDIIKIDSITQLYDLLGYEKPIHLLVSVMDLSKAIWDIKEETKVICSLYNVSLKTKYLETPIYYG